MMLEFGVGRELEGGFYLWGGGGGVNGCMF